MSVAQIVIYVCLPLAVGVWAWFRFRKRRNLRAKQHESCQCDAIVERAREMNDRVDSKIREMDSRNPDKPDRQAITTITFPLIMTALLLTFLLGMGAGRETVKPVLAVEVREKADSTPPGSFHGQFETKLAELRTRPTLAVVSAIDRTPPIPERRAEVLAALKPLLQSDSKSIQLVARNAVKRWE